MNEEKRKLLFDRVCKELENKFSSKDSEFYLKPERNKSFSLKLPKSKASMLSDNVSDKTIVKCINDRNGNGSVEIGLSQELNLKDVHTYFDIPHTNDNFQQRNFEFYEINDENYHFVMELIERYITICIESLPEDDSDNVSVKTIPDNTGLIRRRCQYTADDVRNRLTDIGCDEFYKAPCVNYRGRAKDTGELYSEIISEWLLNDDNYMLFDNITPILREHDNYIHFKDRKARGRETSADSPRVEENMATELVQSHLNDENARFDDSVGFVFDKQVPLNETRNDDAGKIDLISYNKNTNTVHLFELKTMDSTETMLRCVLEIYTYRKILSGRAEDRLLSEVKEIFGITNNPKIEIHPLVFKDADQIKEYNASKLKKLMNKLNITPYYYVCDKIVKEGKYGIPLITSISEYKNNS